MDILSLKERGLAAEWMTEESLQMLKGGYLSENESPIDAYRRVASVIANALKRPDLEKSLFTVMWNNWFCPASPLLSNLGTSNYPISCFSSTTTDSTIGYMKHATELAMLTKRGGGVGSYLGDMRPAGSKISSGGTSDGVIPFAKIMEATIEGIKQGGGKRRGSVAQYLPFAHGDIDAFLDIRKPTGDLSRRCLAVSYHNAVCITDNDMNDVISNPGKFRDRWNKLLSNRVELGEPYILFTDNANKNCPEKYKGRITHSNLCVAPETLILTSEGYKKISTLVDNEVMVWNGNEFSKTIIKKTGENQSLIKIQTDSGHTLECTPYHKFYVKNSYYQKHKEVRANELKPGDKLIKFNLPVIEGHEDFSNAYVNGFFSGSGCTVENKQRVYLCGDKKNLKYKFEQVDWIAQEQQDREYFDFDNLEIRFKVPDVRYSIKSRLDWFAGVLDSNGVVLVNKKSKNKTIQLLSVEEGFLEQVMLMLQTLGITSKVIRDKHTNRLLISSHGINHLKSLGLECHSLDLSNIKSERNVEHFIKITSIEDFGRKDNTYCFTEEKRNMGMFNGILTGNCSEILAPVTPEETFVCCLSSLNVARYDEWKDWRCPISGLTLVELSIYALDGVISVFIKQAKDTEGFENSVRFAENHRMLGLGVLGWHTYLQQKMLSFESFEAMTENATIFKKIRDEADSASIKLALEYGECKETRGTGRRNTATLAIAPTMSNSVLSGGVSQGIEPITANLFVQKAAKGTFIKKNSLLEKLLIEKKLDNSETWMQINKDLGSVRNIKGLSEEEKQVFLTAREINQFAIVRQAAQRQKYIDQAQSINLFFSLPEKEADKKAVARYINEVHIEAWKLGVKSLYYLKTASPIKGMSLAKESSECVACEA